MSNEIAVIPETGATLFRTSTDAAGLCKAIVVETARNIQGRKYVQVEGWQAIAVAHGCTASSGEVKKTEDGGFSAIGKVIRMDTGMVIASAEGYVGPDEPTWFGGKNQYGKELPKRPDYAIRAMAQTRAISRACRSAFAHVVVMMNAGLSTTPAEEVPAEGFDDHPKPTPMPEKVKQAAATKRQPVTIEAEPISGAAMVGEAINTYKQKARGTISGDPSEGDLSGIGITPDPTKPSAEQMSKLKAAFHSQLSMTPEMIATETGFGPIEQWTIEQFEEAREVFKALKQERAATANNGDGGVV